MAERGQPDQNRGYEQNNPDSSSANQPMPQRLEVSSRESEDEGGRGNESKRTGNRGFAAMDPEKQKRIASEGGRAAHRQGVAHEWSRDEAREAGRKGGQIVSQNRDHMSEIGRKGGQSSGQRRQRNGSEE